MRYHTLILAFNCISILLVFFVFLHQSTPVEGSRPLQDRHPFAFVLGKAYSGPSQRGRGH
ncbi:hypothetical protein RHMOL_Rhmol11G0235400 [Rhododendron molle]|uniref:Uncharacterized protein n=1 Tax=Rhododendron molle TaxID=49168 RepID=A0ACC0LVI6_RHOML|nr:hypothetical protein RHMOL_Rhmol11G0235400 [Rhododendron molle]